MSNPEVVFGTRQGTGATSGSMDVPLGFQPKFVIYYGGYTAVFDTDSTDNLYMQFMDSASVGSPALQINSNGFRLTFMSAFSINDSNRTYAYLAFK